MAYGIEALSQEEQSRLKEEWKVKTIEEYRQENVGRQKERNPLNAEGRQNLKSRYQATIQANIKNAGWLTNIEHAKKANIDRKMDETRELFKMSKLSWTQRSKRGEKFKNKATLQAKMLNQAQLYSWKSMDETAEIPAEEDTLLADIAVYRYGFEQQEGDVSKEREKLIKGETKDTEITRLIQEVKDIDLGQFTYKTDEQFTANFAKNYAYLRMLSHAIEYRDDPKYMGMDLEDSKLEAKMELIKEILEDYQSRSALIQSPYYTLMAGKDLDKLSDNDIQQRIQNCKERVKQYEKKGKLSAAETTEHDRDLSVISYLEAVLSRRQSKGFGKGKGGGEILAELAEIEKSRKAVHEENVEKDREVLTSYREKLSDAQKEIEKDKNYPTLTAVEKMEKAFEVYAEQKCKDWLDEPELLQRDEREGWMPEFATIFASEHIGTDALNTPMKDVVEAVDKYRESEERRNKLAVLISFSEKVLGEWSVKNPSNVDQLFSADELADRKLLINAAKAVLEKNREEYQKLDAERKEYLDTMEKGIIKTQVKDSYVVKKGHKDVRKPALFDVKRLGKNQSYLEPRTAYETKALYQPVVRDEHGFLEHQQVKWRIDDILENVDSMVACRKFISDVYKKMEKAKAALEAAQKLEKAGKKPEQLMQDYDKDLKKARQESQQITLDYAKELKKAREKFASLPEQYRVYVEEIKQLEMMEQELGSLKVFKEDATFVDKANTGSSPAPQD